MTTSSGGTNAANSLYTYSTSNDAPSASSVMINGSAQAGTQLSGIYNYADAEGDPEGTSTFRWRTSTTYPTITSGVTVATTQTYTPVSADNDKYLYFCVTPVASAGTTTGVEVCSSGLSVVVPQATSGITPPVASSVAISGASQVGSSLSGTYTFSDADGDTQGTSTFRWVANSVNTGVTGGTTLARTQTYTPSSSNLGKYLYFCVTPVSSAGTLSGTEVCTSATAAVTLSNAEPVASSVAITGTAQVGVQLSGSYSFSDADSDAQGTSTFRWIANTLNTGITGGTALATSQNYTPTSANLGKYIYFCVTPVATTGTLTGTEVCSSATAAVEASTTALSTITNYASGGTAPTTSTYGDAGVTGVTSSNLAGINSFLASLTSTQRDSTSEVQAMVNAYAAVIAAADGNASNAAPTLSAAQFAALGLSNMDSTAELSLLNDVIGRLSNTAVDTQSELAALASVVERIMAQAAGAVVNPALTVGDLTSLGLTGVTSANLSSVLAAIAATADNGSGVDNLSKLQAVVSSVVDGVCGVVTATAFAPPVANLCSAGSINGTVLAGVAGWTWTCNGSGGGVSASCSAPFASTATNGVSGHVLISGSNWEIDRGNSGFVGSGNVVTPPANVNFPLGLLSLRLVNGTPGTSASVTINYSEPLPPGTVYWKYGKELNNTTPHWYRYPGAVISSDRKSITLTLKDGAEGDDDLTPDGVIVDPGGPGVSEATAAIPTLSEWAMLFLASFMLLGFAQMRREGRKI